jgi:hypothetical protein
MSVIRVVHIACNGTRPDRTPCDRMFLDADGNATAMRREARLAGWTIGIPGGKDYCPEHADQAKQEVTR